MSIKDSIVINNGEKQKFINKNEEIPKGWKKGLLDKKKKERLEKFKKTCLEKFGTDNPSKNKKVRKKYEESCYKKFGSNSPNKSEEVKKKKRITLMRNYGVIVPFKSEKIKKKYKETIKKRFNVNNVFLSKKINEKKKETLMKHYGVDCPFKSKEIKEKIRKTNLERYGIEYNCQLPQCIIASYSNESKETKKFASLLKKENIEFEREIVLGNYRYDFKIKNILVEINPTVTHNSYKGIFEHKGKDKYYHRRKSLFAIHNGYYILNIYEWEDMKEIVNHIKDNISFEKIIEKKNYYFGICSLDKYINSNLLNKEFKFYKLLEPGLYWSKNKKVISEKERLTRNLSKSFLIDKYYYPIYTSGKMIFIKKK